MSFDLPHYSPLSCGVPLGLFNWLYAAALVLLTRNAPPSIVLLHCYTGNTFSYEVLTGTYLKVH